MGVLGQINYISLPKWNRRSNARLVNQSSLIYHLDHDGAYILDWIGINRCLISCIVTIFSSNQIGLNNIYHCPFLGGCQCSQTQDRMASEAEMFIKDCRTRVNNTKKIVTRVSKPRIFNEIRILLLLLINLAVDELLVSRLATTAQNRSGPIAFARMTTG